MWTLAFNQLNVALMFVQYTVYTPLPFSPSISLFLFIYSLCSLCGI